jgi:histone H2A
MDDTNPTFLDGLNAGFGPSTVGGRGSRPKMKARSRSKMAGLIFPISRTERIIRRLQPHTRLAATTGIYLAATVEYLVAEILDIAGSTCLEKKAKRITARHIVLSIADDDALNRLLTGVTVRSGGVVGLIHSALLPKKKTPAKSKSVVANGLAEVHTDEAEPLSGDKQGDTNADVEVA